MKKIPEGSHQYDMLKHAAATLGSGNLKLAVQLPEGEDANEWIAVNSKVSLSPFSSPSHHHSPLSLLPHPCQCVFHHLHV